jgi:hypothetical protein
MRERDEGGGSSSTYTPMPEAGWPVPPHTLASTSISSGHLPQAAAERGSGSRVGLYITSLRDPPFFIG